MTKREIEREYLFQSLCEDFKKLQAENDDLRKRLEQEPCEDVVSRPAVIKAVDAHTNEDGTLDDDISIILEDLPSVTPIRPKGEWLLTHEFLAVEGGSIDYIKCSCCEMWSLEQGDFCPNCGADMRGENDAT